MKEKKSTVIVGTTILVNKEIVIPTFNEVLKIDKKGDGDGKN